MAPPVVHPATAAEVDFGEHAKPEPVLPPPEMTLGIEGSGGLHGRLSGNTDGYQNNEPFDMTFALQGWFAPNRLDSVGLGYQRTGLGGASTGPLQSSLSVEYDVNTIWAAGRAYPMRSDDLGLFVQLELGASWQQLSANGTRVTNEFTTPAVTFACSETDGPGLALGGGVGLDIDIDRHLAFTALLDATGHRLTGDIVNGCAPGVGTVTGVAARIGFMYRFELEPSTTGGVQSRRASNDHGS
jgi:hypothetical protein